MTRETKSAAQVCKRCEKRGQTWTGSAPQCAFSDTGEFLDNNWNCATMNELRDRAENRSVWSEDQNAALLPFDGRFIVLSWYKRRGKTELALFLDGPDARRLTIDDAEEYLEVPHAAD